MSTSKNNDCMRGFTQEIDQNTKCKHQKSNDFMCGDGMYHFLKKTEVTRTK